MPLIHKVWSRAWFNKVTKDGNSVGNGGNMIRVKVEYDAYNRRFKLIDREFGSILEDGGTYELTLPLTLPDLCEDELISISEVTIPLTNAPARILPPAP